ncbi:MAG: hypothetical protein A2Z97_03915 [Bdellovibrionales bacterium GWB1_52_6]|nr:MAG: hypothetical protein A2Z97_03915 [Bdellovibrionales bacterium GWB1_52_6]
MAVLAFGACNTTQGQVLGAGQVAGPSAQTPAGSSSGGGNGTETKAALGNGCHSGDSSKYCVALKYVVMKDANDAPAISQAETLANLESMNKIWSQCGITFQIDQYEEVTPSGGVSASPSAMGELDTIRNAYGDDTTLLVATTAGSWSLSANAWTSMPGSAPYGAVIEGAVGAYAPIIAHEIGHYLSLDHVSNQAELMNPVIYSTSTQLSEGECTAARASIDQSWAKMVR